MALRTAKQYLDSLRDDRVVYYAGERIKNVVDHPHFGIPQATIELMPLKDMEG